MYELIYKSSAKKTFSEPELQELREVACEYNRENNISGILYYKDNEFIQLLEGEKSAVLELFELINKDSRHHRLNVFYQGNIKKRAFPCWVMSFESEVRDHSRVKHKCYLDINDHQFFIKILKYEPNTGKELFLLLSEQMNKKSTSIS